MRRVAGGVLALALVLAGCEVGRVKRSALDRGTERAWPARRAWDPALEDEYAAFVETLGRAVEARRCARLDACLALPEANPFHDPAVDGTLRLDVDCADLPYVLRAYFSFRRQLPFGFVAEVRGAGDEIRYADAVLPSAFRSWRDFATPRALLRFLVNAVHTGTMRIGNDVDGGDFYPVRVERRAIRPGAVYYDPLGHVSVVARVDDDGTVFFIESTPESLLVWRRFGAVYKLGTAAVGGGFKRFRPVALARGRVVRAANRDLADFDPATQHDPSAWTAGGHAVSFDAWVKARLALAARDVDEVAEFRDRVRALCRDLLDRAEAVDLATRDGLPEARRPRALPPDLHAASGLWETYSTPARDGRLRAGFRELYTWTRDLDELFGLSLPLRQVWEEEARSPACRVVYTGSHGAPVELSLDQVLDRLFDLSFDPYHCPELRWGAPEGSLERAACPDDERDLAWYEDERRARNRAARGDGPATLEGGPDAPPEVDVRRLIADDRPPLDL
jgi:hypothetical protein